MEAAQGDQTSCCYPTCSSAVIGGMQEVYPDVLVPGRFGEACQVRGPTAVQQEEEHKGQRHACRGCDADACERLVLDPDACQYVDDKRDHSCQAKLLSTL